jgi:hypothetical protein
MSWGDSHCKTFSAQAEPRNRADYPGEKVAPSVTAARSRRFGCMVRVSSCRRAASSGLCGVQLIRGMRRAMLSIADP